MDEIRIIAKVLRVTALVIGFIAVAGILYSFSTPPTWNCIEGSEDVGFARMCEVGDCHVLFIGDDVMMECGR